MFLRCMNIEKRMHTSKYRALSSLLSLTFLCVWACEVNDEVNTGNEWIGFAPHSTFEIRAFPQNRVVSSERNEVLTSFINRLNGFQKEPCRTVRLTVIGDSRAAYDGVGTSIYWPAMLTQMERLSPEVILHVGDLVKNGRNKEEWITYLRQLPRTTPLIAVRGNHDRGDFFYNWGFGVGEVFKLDIGAARILG